MVRLILFTGILLLNFASEAQKLRVAIASSLLLPFQELEEQFESKYDIDLELISGSSGSLTTQMINGAPYDLFISANQTFPAKLYAENLTSDEPQVLFNGQIYLWSDSEIDGDPLTFIESAAGFRRLAIANPELAPYGTTAKDWLVRNDIWGSLEPKLVFANAIGQVNHYIFTSAVDAALSSNSAAFSTQLRDKGFWYEIEGANISLVPYFMVVLKSSIVQNESQEFVEYLAGEESKKLLTKFGFVIAE